MITKRTVCNAIDKAADDIDFCWNVLVSLRVNKDQPPISSEIISLQKKLISALWVLDDAYREIHTERKRLIARKTNFSSSWFRGRMAALASYQEAIRHTISIARTVGDGFAWIFYMDETKLIDAHLKVPRQVHLPPNIGRIGERAFIENFQVTEGKLVLYHGITTFLRMGDVSFYDFSERRITNIGELKTEHVKGGEYRVTLGFVYGGNFTPVIDISRIHQKDSIKSSMLPRQSARMNRQLKQIMKAVSVDETRVSQTTSQRGHFYFEEIDRLIVASNTKAIKSKKVGEGLLIVVLRQPRAALLSKRLMGDKKFYVGKKLEGIELAAQSIMDASVTDNSLLVSSLGVSERGLPGLMKGAIPIFWWPLKISSLHDLIFSKVIAMTLYNPAHFWRSLRARGFQLSIDDRARLLSAKKRVGRHLAEVHNFGYFQTLIIHHLMSENDVLAIIESALQFPFSDNAPMHIEINPQLRL